MRAGLAASTVTPGSTAPDVSRTTPARDDWAKAAAGRRTPPSAIANRRTRIADLLSKVGTRDAAVGRREHKGAARSMSMYMRGTWGLRPRRPGRRLPRIRLTGLVAACSEHRAARRAPRLRHQGDPRPRILKAAPRLRRACSNPGSVL